MLAPRGSELRILIVAAAAIVIAAIPISPASAETLLRSNQSNPATLLENGVEAYRRGDLADAVESWTRAESDFESTGNVKGQLDALVRRAEAYHELGLYRHAMKDLSVCRELSSANRDAYLAATIAALSSRVSVSAGDALKAESILAEATAGAELEKNLVLLALTYNESGNLSAARRQWLKAVREYRKGIETAIAAKEISLAATSALNGARAARNGSASSEVETFLTQFRENVDRLDPGRKRAWLLLAYGDLLLQRETESVRTIPRDDGLEIYGALQEAADWARSQGDERILSFALGYLSRLYRSEERIAEATSLVHEALRLAESVGDPGLQYRWNWLLGRLLRESRKTDSALAAYERAVSQLASIKGSLYAANFETGPNFRDFAGLVYLELADLYLQRTDSKTTDSANNQVNLEAARSAIERLKLAELEDYYGHECVAELESKKRSVDEYGEGAAVLYPIVLPDRLELLLTVEGQIERFVVRIDSAELAGTVRALRQRLERVTTRQYLPHAQKIYDWLIRPIERHLHHAQVTTLIIVPDGPLRTIPVAALHDGRQFLVEKIAVGVSPGLDLLSARPTSSIANREVLIGAVTEGKTGFTPLPAVSDEVAVIQNLFPSLTLKDKTFSLAQFESALASKPYSIVHIASHSSVAADPTQSYIITFDGKLTLDRLEDLIKRSEFRKEPVELLTLSACSTAAGDDRAALGLAGVGIKAGARSVVAGLWFVNDEASAQLIETFYRDLATQPVTKAEALQRAQQAMIKDPRFGHPGYWSPFILIGNWL